MGWLQDHSWEAWLVLALLLAGAELTTLDFTLLMMAVGAGAGGVVSLLGLNVAFQVVVAVVVAVGMLGVARPNMVRRLHAGPTLKSGTRALVGKSGLVLEQVTTDGGRVRLSGEVWSARALDEFAVLEPGTKVGIAEIDGATAVVFSL